MCLARLPVAHLAYQTAALEAALELLQKPGLDACPGLTTSLLQGVSNHLSSPTSAVRCVPPRSSCLTRACPVIDLQSPALQNNQLASRVDCLILHGLLLHELAGLWLHQCYIGQDCSWHVVDHSLWRMKVEGACSSPEINAAAGRVHC